jgi:oligoribonuclease NrnB/cAMP/cGMP phosphodiesterase (DHH superfamily)
MYCIYHNRDLDGYCSGAIVKYRYPEAELIGFDYQDDVQALFDKIKPDTEVIMVDVSLKMPDMLRLSNHISDMNKFKWIDHHVSAIKDYEQYTEALGKRFLTPILDVGISACEITWRELFPDRITPVAVILLGQYDTWRNKDLEHWEKNVLPFQFGMRLDCNSPETFDNLFFLKEFENILPHNIVSQGVTVLKYQAKINETQCAKAAFESEIDGYKAICLNGGGFNSDVFKSVYDESKHDVMMPFQFNGKVWIVSLYTTKKDIDVSQIAKKRDGGGHKQAAGFQVQKIEDLFSNLG